MKALKESKEEKMEAIKKKKEKAETARQSAIEKVFGWDEILSLVNKFVALQASFFNFYQSLQTGHND